MTKPELHWREILLCLITLLAVAVVFSMPPIAQDSTYHQFSDNKSLYNIPNFRNTASNLGFVIVGFFGLSRIKSTAPALRLPFALFCLSVILIGPGSAFYHLSPCSNTLVWDRLPMAMAFMSLFALVIQSRISDRLGRWLLWPLLLAGISSVLYWYWSEQQGIGDLRPYALVQYLPMLLIPLLLILYARPDDGSQWIWTALGCYVLAKMAEAADHAVFLASQGLISGHSLKHLLAALAILLAIRAVKHFKPAVTPSG